MGHKTFRGRAATLIATAMLATGVAVVPATVAMGVPTVGSWNVAAAPTPLGSWFAIAYGGGHFVALGHSANVAVSTNGATWSEHPIPAGSWQSLAYGNGRWVALSSVGSGNHEMTSPNGIDWTAVPGPAGQWSGVTYGHGYFVASGFLGQLISSSDGLHWTTTFSRHADHFTSVAFGNARFIAVDSANGDLLQTLDAVHWSFYKSPVSGMHWGAVAYGDGNFVTFDRSGSGNVATTVLGDLWTVHHFAPAQEIDGVTYGCGGFVASGASTASTNDFFTSLTGATWSGVAVPTDSSSTWSSVAFGAHRYVAVDAAGNVAWAPSLTSCNATTPTAPQQVSGNVHSGQVWTYMHPPVAAGGSPVDGYRVTITDGVITKTCFAPVYYEPNCIINGLKNRAVYHVTAQSHNRFGYSVPSDPEFVIPMASWNFNAAAPLVVASSSPTTVQVTGVHANSLGIYPITTATVHVGSRVFTCIPNEFGECLLDVGHLSPGVVPISATYSGYGSSYRSPTNHTTVATVATSSTVVALQQLVAISIHGALAHTVARVSLGASVIQSKLTATGGGTLKIVAPATPGSYALTVSDAGNVLSVVNITVHA